ncbi:OmpH family outer membrane protein [Candidatus Acetothermia bacterium]|nr:OmpH family outer membrane protein [Candidatus Acetothermia bacterium]
MRQNWIWVVLVIAALVVGYLGGQMLSSGIPDDVKKQISTLQSQVKELQDKLTSSSSSGGPLKLAYLDANAVFTQYKGTQGAVEQFKQEREKKQQDFDKIKKDFEAAKISSKDYEEAAAKLQQELQLVDLKLTSEIQSKMLAAIKKIGQAKGYDWVTQKKDVVLYVKNGIMEDITGAVLDELNNQQ